MHEYIHGTKNTYTYEKGKELLVLWCLQQSCQEERKKTELNI